MLTFDVDKAAEIAWNYCGINGAYKNISASTKAQVDKQIAKGIDIHYIYKHKCVGVIRRVWAAAGLNIPGMNSCGTPTDYMNLLSKHPEFYKRVGVESLQTPRYGDVVLYHGGSTVGHGCVYLPIQSEGRWVSDAVQQQWNVYRYSTNKAYDVQVYRFVGDIQGDGGKAVFSDFSEDTGWVGRAEGDTTGWQEAVLKMKTFYENNVHIYANCPPNYDCNLIHGKVRPDCSGFVSACLVLYGLKVYDPASDYPPGSAMMLGDAFFEKIAGAFSRIKFSKEEAKPWDILVGNGHTEIYAGDNKSYSWGRVHDLSHGGMPSPTAWSFGGKTYTSIYRCNGGSGLGSLSPEGLLEALEQYCPPIIEFRGLWMRYHLWMGMKSPIIQDIVHSNIMENILNAFGGVGGGIEPIPPGFYSDEVLFNFVRLAEGDVGLQWVTTYKGHEVATGCGINGYDGPGGVHSKKIGHDIGFTGIEDLGVGITSRGRRANSTEAQEGAAWGWQTEPVPVNAPYWQKFIPYYRDQMIWAWRQPIIQAVKNPAERLARMHSINWWGHHYLEGFSGGSGWSHRLQAAKKACVNMTSFS